MAGLKSIYSLPKMGKQFYKMLVLLAFFIVVPVAAALILSLHTLQTASIQSQNNLSVALNSQIEHSQTANPARNNIEQANKLKENSELLTRLGELDQMEINEDTKIAKALLNSLGVSSPNKQIDCYLYFVKSDYLMGKQVSDQDTRYYADSRIFIGLKDIDPLDTNYSYNRYGPDEEGYYFSTYKAVVAPDVIFICTLTFAEGVRPNVDLTESLTNSLKEMEIAYYDSFGNYHAVTEEQDLTQLYDYASLGSEENGMFSFQNEGHSYLCFYIYNADNHTKFAVFCLDQIGENQRVISHILWGTALLFFIICLVAAIFSAKSACRPIVALVSRLNENNKGSVLRDDYQILENALDSMDSMRSQISEQTVLLQKNFLVRLLKGFNTAIFEGYVDNWLEESNEQSLFSVVMIRIDAMKLDSILVEKDFEAGLFQYFDQRKYFPKTVWDGACLLAVFQMDERTMTDLTADCESYQSLLEDYTVSIYISNIHSGIRELHQCYNEAVSVMEYCIALEKYGVMLTYESVRDSIGSVQTTSLDFSLLQKLSDCATALAVDDALKQYDTIVYQLSENTDGQLGREHMAFSILVNTVALMFYDIDLPSNIGKEILHRHVEKIRSAKNTVELRQSMKECMEAYILQSNEHDTCKERFEQIKEYVEENFRDPNLSSGLVANMFHTNQSGITRMFKKYNQSGFLEFVHQLRVAQAVQLMEETDLTVAEISVLVGYTNTITMTRAFKNYAHTTPGAIRKRKS